VYTSLNPRIFRSHLNGLRSKLNKAENFMNEGHFALLKRRNPILGAHPQ